MLLASAVSHAAEVELYPNLPLVEKAIPNTNGQIPMYPLAARKAGACGQVKILVVVSEAGAVEEAKILSAQPQGYFEDAALSAVKKWSFRPALRDGVATKSQVIVPVLFRLEEAHQCNPNNSFKADSQPLRGRERP